MGLWPLGNIRWMFKKIVNYCSLIIAGLLFVVGSFAQISPVDDYTSLPVGINTPITSGSEVCPSVTGTPSTSVFRVDANTTDAGDPNLYKFEWVVYGGTILNTTGSFSGTIHTAVSTSLHVGYNFSTVTLQGVTASPEQSFITVQWDQTNLANAWVAVRQTSEWNCSDEHWSVYSQSILNRPPEFTASFPPDISLPFYYSTVPFTLVVPSVEWNDNCFTSLQTLTWRVENPEGTPFASGDDSNTSVSLRLGTNLFIWRAFDGITEAIDTQRIRIDAEPQIVHVAWTLPTCQTASDGTLYVSDTINQNNQFHLQYRLDGGAWSSSRYYTGISAGVEHTLQARIEYSVDIDNDGNLDYYEQLSPVRRVTLTLPAAQVIDALPLQTDATHVIYNNPECASGSDGNIEILPNDIVSFNNSLVFNGASDHIKLNKVISVPMSQFSVAAWIKLPTSAVGYGSIISFNNSSCFQLSVTSPSAGGSNYIQFETVPTGNSPDPYFSHPKKINDGKWHFVVATYNGGERVIYVDGIPQRSGTNTSLTVGNGPVYGMIGAKSTATSFGEAAAGYFYTGRMAQVALWESAVADSAAVTAMYSQGITGASMWVLNQIPANVSAEPIVFSDFGNLSAPDEWGRAYGIALANNDAPVLYSWNPPAFPKFILNDIPQGTYELTANDIFACPSSSVNQQYVLENDDEQGPQVLINVALRRPAAQAGDGSNVSCGTTPASLAVDGNLDGDYTHCSVSGTDGGAEEWWQVELASPQRIKLVNVFPPSTNASSDFYVMISSSPLSALGDTSRADVVFRHFTGTFSGTQSFVFDNNARYIRVQNYASADPLYLAEVEVYSPLQLPSASRVFYLYPDSTGNCSYNITEYDGSVDPIFIDQCGGSITYSHDQVLSPPNTMSLVNLELGMNPNVTPVVWSATDDAGQVTSRTINYTLIDTMKPWFTDPYEGPAAQFTLTYCDIDGGYRVPIPNAADNYNCESGGVPDYRFTKLQLDIDGYSDIGNFDSYDPTAPYDSFTINSAYLPEGNHVLVWTLTDFSMNRVTDTIYYTIQRQPRINGLRFAAASCNGTNDGLINIFDIQAQTGLPVNYFVASGADTLMQTDNPLFNALRPGAYSAWIEVNGCRSANYGLAINITEPAPIIPNPYITTVPCFGDSGKIEMYYLGVNKDKLHLTGGIDNIITTAHYTALDITGQGTVEAWVYLDSLSATVNANACFICGNGFGIGLTGGALSLGVGGVNVLTGPALAQRTWYHVAGSWNETETVLYVNGSSVATGPAATNTPTGGGLYLGCNGTPDPTSHFQGIIQFARVWSSTLTAGQIGSNVRYPNPINYNNSLVANFPLNVDGGSSVSNTVTGSAPGVLVTSPKRYDWQGYAFVWTGETTPHVSYMRNLENVPAQRYTLNISTPYGCLLDTAFTLNMSDNQAPKIIFHEDPSRLTADVDNILIRTTSQFSAWVASDGLNVPGDCDFFPLGGEFNPLIDDGECDANDVILTWQFVDLSQSGTLSVDSIPFSDIVAVRWDAVDGAGNPANRTITYRIQDNEKPALGPDVNTTVYTNTDDCFYTVPDATSHVPVPSDNCLGYNDRLWNNYTFTENLSGQDIPQGLHQILWFYRDKWNNIDTMVLNLNVVDNQPPQALCDNVTLNVDNTGMVTIDSSYIDANSNDNCYEVSNILIVKNLARMVGVTVGGTPPAADPCNSRDKVIDGNTDPVIANCFSYLSTSGSNPNVVLTFPDDIVVRGIRIFAATEGDPLDNVQIRVASSPVFSPATYDSTYIGGPIAGDMYFPVTGGAVGNRVQVRLLGNPRQLGLAEVQVFGYKLSDGDSSHLTFDCDEIQYTGTPGNFDPMDVALVAVDKNGLESYCISQVTLRDMIPPRIVPRLYEVSTDASGSALLIGDSLVTGRFDNCAVDTVYCVPDRLYCGSEGENTVNVIMRDVNGNESQLPVRVTLTDTLPPVAVPQSNIQLYVGANGTHIINAQTEIDGGSYDNCATSPGAGIALYEVTPNEINCSMVGSTINLQFSVTDSSNNITTIPVSAEVLDDMAPVPSIKNFTLVLPSTGSAIVYFDSISNSVTDNCTPTSLISKSYSFNYNPITMAGSWCPAGDEDELSAPPGSNDVSHLSESISGSPAFSSSYVVENSIDAFAPTTYSYITNGTTGDRYIYMGFSEPYVITGTRVWWHQQSDLGSTPSIISTAATVTNDAGEYDPPGPNNHVDEYARDNNSGTVYITNSRIDVDYNCIMFDVGSSQAIDSFVVFWHEQDISADNTLDCRLPFEAYVKFGGSNNNNDWNSRTAYPIGVLGPGTRNSLNISLLNISARYIRIYFRRSNSDRARVGIRDFLVYGRTAEVACEAPRNAYLEYYNGSWQNAGSIGNSTADYNTLSPIVIPATDSVRLRFNRSGWSDRRIGVKDWEVLGYAQSSESGCRTWDCDSVHTTQDVWLRYDDRKGNDTIVHTTFDIEPYFNIREIKLMDCAVSGEQYWAWVDNRPSSYSYIWTQNNTAPPYLFNNSFNSEAPVNSFTSNSDTIAQLRISRDILPDNRNYTIQLRVEDNNSPKCWDEFDYTFYWDNGGGGGATTIKDWFACVNTYDTIYAELVTPETYWLSLDYDWTFHSSVNVESGGDGIDSAIVYFTQSGYPIPVTYNITGQQQNVRELGYAPGNVGCTVNFPCYRRPANAPYLLTNPITTTTNFTNPAEFIVMAYGGTGSTGGQSWIGWGFWGEYAQMLPGSPYINILGNYESFRGTYYYTGTGWALCEEGVTYNTTVFEVAPPVLDDPILSVCPCDTVRYEIDTTYTSHYWTVTGGDIVRGGNGNDNYVEVAWSCDEPRVWSGTDSIATVTLRVENPLGCSASSTDTVNFERDWESTPTITCPPLTRHPAALNACAYTYPNLPVPTLDPGSEDCRIFSLLNDKNNTSNARGLYPIGETLVTWTVTDYVGNTSTCVQRVIVDDEESPTLVGNSPYDIDDLTTSPTSCDTLFSASTHDISARDNCDNTGTYLTYTTIIDYGDDGADMDTLHNTRSINGIRFAEGITRVTYIVADTSYFYNTKVNKPNTTSVSFTVRVSDKTPPVFNTVAYAAIDTFYTNTSVGERFVTYSDLVSNGFVGPDPAVYCTDNCTPVNDIDTVFQRRSDNLTLQHNYPIGTTVITWRASDNAGNYNDTLQWIVVSDNEPPTIETLADTVLTACQRVAPVLQIPITSDNSDQLDTLFLSITGSAGYSFADTITVDGFDPNGNGFTDPIPDLSPESDYTVTWRVVDHYRNSNSSSQNIHVEVEPWINPDPLVGYSTNSLECGGTNTGRIRIEDYHFESGAEVEFTVDGWSNYIQSTVTHPANPNEFINLPGGNYGLQIRVNDCPSNVVAVILTEPRSYDLDGVVTHPYCEEGRDGEIAPIVTGGVNGQFLQTGSAHTVAHYNNIDATLDFTSAGMLEAWVYLTDANTSAMIVSKGGSYGLGLNGGSFALYNNGTVVATASMVPELQRWYHVAGSWNGSGCQVYVGGSESGSGSGFTAGTSASGLSIGQGFNGIIRELRIWSNDWTTVTGLGYTASEKLIGNENYLEGYWPLDNIIGGVSPNRTNGGNEATVASGSWQPTPATPQPGTYSWVGTELLTGASYTNDSIFIHGLAAGTYTLTFFDIYGCPNVVGGEIKTYYLEATDNIPPIISTPTDVPLLLADNSCEHIIDPLEADYLLPVITSNDGYDCGYTLTWEVWWQEGNVTQSYASLVGATLGIGLNTIRVTAIQNSQSRVFEYDVEVVDQTAPTPDADYDDAVYLQSDGTMIVDAEDFNGLSDDNCTDPLMLTFEASRDGGTTFSSTVTFSCADVGPGNKVDIVLRAFDSEGNNADSDPITVEVRDTISPYFIAPPLDLEPECADEEDGGIGLRDGITGIYLEDGTGYADNCGISEIYYRIDNVDRPGTPYSHPAGVWKPINGDWTQLENERFYQGTTQVWFYLVDNSGNGSPAQAQILFNVRILDMPNPAGIGSE